MSHALLGGISNTNTHHRFFQKGKHLEKMAQIPIDLKLYFSVQDIIMGKTSNSSNAMSKSGSLYSPQFPIFPENNFDEVYPKLYLGSRHIVKDFEQLKSLGITHIVNASMGTKFNQICTGEVFYQESNIKFHGIPAMDIPTFQILPYLKDAAIFIDQALSNNGVVYVHCQQGISRSSTVVLAFLMLKRDMDLLPATKMVKSKRSIHPNDGFLKQLCQLQDEINKTKAEKDL